MKYFFTSDYHLSHANIIHYTGRTLFMNEQELALYNKLIDEHGEVPRSFNISKESIDKMNTAIINRCNERVKEDDILFFLGDFALRRSAESPDAQIGNPINIFRPQIKCKQIYFVGGNHDKDGQCKTPIQSMTIQVGKHRIFLTHNPKWARQDYKFNICGHWHGKFGKVIKQDNIIVFDVSVENYNYYPQTFDELYSEYYKWRKKQ